MPTDQDFVLKALVTTTQGEIRHVVFKQVLPAVDLSGYTESSAYWEQPKVKSKFVFDGLKTIDATTGYLY